MLCYFQGKRKKWRPFNVERIYTLAIPIIRLRPKLRDPFKVPPHALTYQLTKRMESLAVEKKRPEIPLRIPGVVSPAATKAIGRNTHLAVAITTVIIPPLRSSRFDFSARYAPRNRPHRSAGSVVAYIASPYQYYYTLLDVVSKLIRGVSQRTSFHRDSTWTLARFFPWRAFHDRNHIIRQEFLNRNFNGNTLAENWIKMPSYLGLVEINWRTRLFVSLHLYDKTIVFFFFLCRIFIIYVK